jgi:hypothetical protein
MMPVFAFSGHTEYIAGITSGHPVMMLATPGLRVALVTTHLPLVNVSPAITHTRLRTVIRILDHDLRTRFHLDNPKILVCGLNPHAGENGHLGREEIDIIEPVLENLRQQGLNLHGPLPCRYFIYPQIPGHSGCRASHVSRSGPACTKIPGLWKICQYHTGTPNYPHLCRSRHSFRSGWHRQS